MNELTISLFMITLVVVIFALMLYKFYLNKKTDKMYSAWRDIKQDNAKLIGIDKKFQALTLKHSGLISKLRNDTTLSKQTKEYLKEYI